MTDKPDYNLSRRKMISSMLTGLTAASVPSWFISEAHAAEMSKETLWEADMVQTTRSTSP